MLGFSLLLVCLAKAFAPLVSFAPKVAALEITAVSDPSASECEELDKPPVIHLEILPEHFVVWEEGRAQRRVRDLRGLTALLHRLKCARPDRTETLLHVHDDTRHERFVAVLDRMATLDLPAVFLSVAPTTAASARCSDTRR